LTVAKPPTWANNMQFDQELWETAGKTLELKCPAEGYPAPKIQWLKDDKPLSDRSIGNVSIPYVTYGTLCCKYYQHCVLRL